MRLHALGIRSILVSSGYQVKILRGANASTPILASKFREIVLRYIYYPFAICRSSASIVHIIDHSYCFLAPIVKLLNKHCIVTIHNSIHDVWKDETWEKHTERSFVPWLSKILFRFSLNQIAHADTIFSVSKDISKSLIAIGVPREKIIKIIAPISDLFFSIPTPKEKLYIQKELLRKGDTSYILHVGNNDPAHKNVEHVIRCMKILIDEGIRVVFIKVGEPFSFVQQQLIQSFGIDSKVRHLGYQSQSDLKCIYHYSDILISPSYYEGYPATPIEAFVCGLTVIASDIPAHREIKDVCSYFVNPDDYTLSAYLVKKILSKRRNVGLRRATEKQRATHSRWGDIQKTVLDSYKLYTH